MRTAYRVIANAIAAGVVLQAAFIAYGFFQQLSDLDAKKAIHDDNAGQVLHMVVGEMVFPVLGLALLVVAFLTRLPEALRWAGLVLLVMVVQILLAMAGTSVPALGALHGINAFVLAGVASVAARRVATAEGTTAGAAGTSAV
ncbi:MAG: hypothetical protein QOJ90_3052 [Actinomycetota bacterium]|nr:hypothetical protein [Actinomycetota bacterium]MDQ1643701.1 hypothetical protein [Actinomycetota bacterium]